MLAQEAAVLLLESELLARVQLGAVFLAQVGVGLESEHEQLKWLSHRDLQGQKLLELRLIEVVTARCVSSPVLSHRNQKSGHLRSRGMNVIASGITGIILRVIPPVTVVQLAAIQLILRRAIPVLQAGAQVIHRHRGVIRVGALSQHQEEVWALLAGDNVFTPLFEFRLGNGVFIFSFARLV